MNYLLLKVDGKLYCADLPTVLKPKYRLLWSEEEKTEAIANALPVINPEILQSIYFEGKTELLDGLILGVTVNSRLYPWNGGAEVIEKTVTGYVGNQEMDADYPIGVRLSLPDNTKDQEKETQEQLWREVADRMRNLQGFSGIDNICDHLAKYFTLIRR